ncbi:hypothetical protein GBAR_LOCUS25665 [Geodia barretti]|nr:hypothetical protein GBAR_LOCUS25665 [Geodia barretti]
MSALHYNVNVIAKNLLSDGYSDGRICNNMTISARNDLLSVDVRKNFSEVVQILCRPLTRFEGTASCEVVYRMMVPGADSYTETSDRAGGAEDIISVLLTPTTGPGTNLSVAAGTRGGKQDVVVEGTFGTGDILSSRENLMRHLCPENNMTDATQDSTTEVPTAVDASTESCPTIPWILAPGIFIVTLPTGFIAGIIVMIVWRSKRKQTGTGGEQNTTPLYEYITSKDITMARNESYTGLSPRNI